MKIMITGGTTWFGQSIVQRILARGHEIVCFDEVPLPWRVELPRPVPVLQGSVADMSGLLTAVRRERPDAIVNRDVRYGEETEIDYLRTVQVNLIGAMNVFEVAASVGIKRVVYESSIGVYGAQDEHGDRDLSEDDDRFVDPPYVFRLTQHAVEFFAERMAKQSAVELVGTRPSVCHSPLKDKGVSRWSNDFVSLPATGKPMRFPYPREQRTSLLWVDDAAEVYARLADQSTLAHRMYNSGGYDVSLQELTEMVRRIIPEAEYDFPDPRSVPPQPMPCRVSGQRAHDDLGIALQPLEATLAEHASRARHLAGMPPLSG